MIWFLLLPISISFTLLAFTLNPILPLFANNQGYLPKWLWWFQTPDNPLDGDGGFINEHAFFKGTQVGIKRYINRVTWLYRNPAYAFDWEVLSATPTNKPLVYGTKPLTGDLKSSGWVFARSGKYWQLYITLHYNSVYTTKINLGWKLWLIPNRCQYVCSIGLLKKI